MTSMSKHPKITSYMNHLLERYEDLRGNKDASQKSPFWDIVVITASDAAQQKAYQLQIDEKNKRKELPLDLIIHVVTDPPGIRIGNGGSTLTSLEFLHKKYKDKLFEFKILLIHAGGWSQRLPSATVLGKIFSILPHGNTPFQMLDLKLALYWPFVDRIQPGIFLVCADDFLVFDLDTDKEWLIPGKGFTALAHPTLLEFGKSHGVYVLADTKEMDTSKPVDLCECLRVLQKPTESRMKSEGALLNGSSCCFGDGIQLQGEVVYTDSCFYFGTDIMKKLLKLKESVGDLSCEIDAYGDFLQAVGKNNSNDYIHLTSNVSQPTPNLLAMRQTVFDTLNESDIHVLVLNSSKFMHIGTTKELLHYFCSDDEFQQLFNMGKDVFNSWGNKKRGDCNGLSKKACLIHCSLSGDSKIGSECFLEFCDFEKPVTVSPGCIISNCQISTQESQLQHLSVPSHTFIHTIPILDQLGTTEFVTIFFHVDDNLKKSISLEEVGSLSFLGSNIDDFVSKEGIDIQDILPEAAVVTGHNDTNAGKEKSSSQKMPLWNLKLFKAKSSMTSSLEDALSLLNSSDRPMKRPKISHKLFSMASLLSIKNVESMLSYRQILYEKIIKNN